MWLRQRQGLLLQPFPEDQQLTGIGEQQHITSNRNRQAAHLRPAAMIVNTHAREIAPSVTTQIPPSNITAPPPPQMPTAMPTTNLRLLRTNANDAIKPTILTVNSYISLENLVRNKRLHKHDVILNGKKMKKDDWANHKSDPNNWSRLKILYQRIADRQSSTSETIEEAARWLDINERNPKKFNLNQYLQYLKEDDTFGGQYTVLAWSANNICPSQLS